MCRNFLLETPLPGLTNIRRHPGSKAAGSERAFSRCLPFGRDRDSGRRRGFTLIELLVVVAILSILAALAIPVAQRAMLSSSLAVSANNIRQLGAGAMAYLGDNNYTFWRYRQNINTPEQRGTAWWFGFEPAASQALGEGKRTFDPEGGPLGGYIPGGMRPDPSFAATGKPFKPKYRFGYIGVGYNTHLGGGWMGGAPIRYFELEKPEETVIFATSAQVNTFQSPASSSNPMIEEFYGVDSGATGVQPCIHFRHHGKAMVFFAAGSAGFLPVDQSTIDPRAPEAMIGRFAPRGSTRYLR
jgi:prepilin-type N-terminal cleavage/methylation domain-containing protein